MAFQEIGPNLTPQELQKINANFQQAQSTIDNITGEVLNEVIGQAQLIWKEPVNTFEELTTTYPTPEVGWTSMARDDGKVYRHNGTSWAEIQQIDASPINELDSRLTGQLDEKVTKGEGGSVTWAMAAQDFREQITGGNTAVVGVNSVLETNIVDKQVTPNKTSFLKKQRINLFNKDVYTNSGLLSSTTGNFDSNPAFSGFKTTDYIEIDPTKTYKRVNLTLATSTSFAFYDANKVFIVAPTSNNPDIIPSNAKYIRICYSGTPTTGMYTLSNQDTTTYIPYDKFLFAITEPLLVAEIENISTNKANLAVTTELNDTSKKILPDKISEKSITPKKLSVLNYYNKNLFNKDDTAIVYGYRLDANNTDNTFPDASYYISHYIPVEEGKNYSFPIGFTTLAYIYYDTNKVRVPYSKVPFGSVPVPTGLGIKYIRVTGKISDIATVMFSEESDVTLPKKYYPYNTHRAELLDSSISDAVGKKLLKNGVGLFKGTQVNLLDSDKLQYGKVMDDLSVQITTVWNLTLCYLFPVETGKTYSLNSTGKILLFDSSKVRIGSMDSTGGQTQITIDANTKYIQASFPKDQAMIVEGTTLPVTYLSGETFNPVFATAYQRDAIATDLWASTVQKQKTIDTINPNTYGKKWACLGDSYTANSWGNNYASMVAANLGLTPINYGIVSSTIADYGDTTGDNPMCYRYMDMDNSADIITVLACVNDYASRIGTMADRNPVDSFYGGCHTLFAGLCAKYPGKKIGIISSTQNARSTASDTEFGTPDIDLKGLESKVNAMKQVAEYYSLPFLDLFHGGGMNGFVAEHRATFWQADKLHPTTAGYQVMARQIEAFIKRL